MAFDRIINEVRPSAPARRMWDRIIRFQSYVIRLYLEIRKSESRRCTALRNSAHTTWIIPSDSTLFIFQIQISGACVLQPFSTPSIVLLLSFAEAEGAPAHQGH